MDDLIHRLASASSVTPGEAADHIDKLIHKILARLREGESVPVPGLGQFTPGPPRSFRPEVKKDDGKRSNRGTRTGR